MTSKKLREMIANKSGNLKTFAMENNIKYTTIYNAVRSDEQLSHMSIKMFREIAHGLCMTIDELIDMIEEGE